MSSRERATQQRAMEKQRAILTAARSLILNEGMKAATHRRVADHAGVPTSSVRYYFSSRGELLVACIDEMEVERAREARSILSQAPKSPIPKSQIGAYAVRIIWGPDDSDAGLIGMVGATLDGVRESPRLAARMREIRPIIDQDLKELLEISGYPPATADLFTVVVNGSIVDAAAEGLDGVAERAAINIAMLLN